MFLVCVMLKCPCKPAAPKGQAFRFLKKLPKRRTRHCLHSHATYLVFLVWRETHRFHPMAMPTHKLHTQTTAAVLLAQLKRLGWLLLFFEGAEPARAVH